MASNSGCREVLPAVGDEPMETPAGSSHAEEPSPPEAPQEEAPQPESPLEVPVPQVVVHREEASHEPQLESPQNAIADASEADSSVHVSDDSWGVGRSASAKAEVFATEISGEELRLRVGVQSVQGARKTMEDEHQIVNDCTGGKVSFFGVYDGHAGKKAAEFLRDQLHTSLYNNGLLQADPELALKEAIMEAEAAFLARAKEEKLDDGSTLAVVLICGNEMVTANVGDSEIVLCRGTKPLVLSTAHNMMKNNAEEQRVKDAGGVVFRSRLGHPYINPQLISIAVTRSIGDITFKDTDFTAGRPSGLIAMPDTRRVRLTTDDEFFLIGCDGLWDVMAYDEAINFVRARLTKGWSPQRVSEHLVKEALRRGSKDNITVLIVAIRENPNIAPLDEDELSAPSESDSSISTSPAPTPVPIPAPAAAPTAPAPTPAPADAPADAAAGGGH